MRPLDLQHIGSELALKWGDGREQFIALEKLRRACPCAGCKGEFDILGNLHKNPDKPFLPNSFNLVKISSVGSYAIQPIWADGHNSGIYSFEYLRALTSCN